MWKKDRRYSCPTNPRIFMDVARDGEVLGRMTFELFAQKVPKTVHNFLALIEQDHPDNLTGKGYLGSKFYRIIGEFMAQGGDIVK